MDEVRNTGPGAETLELAALSARVAELERVVRILTQRGGAATQRPAQRPQPPMAAAPPPPVPEAALPRISGPVAGPTASPAAMVDGVPLVSPMSSRPIFPQIAAPQRKVPAAGEGKSLENRLGAQVFNLVGILALVISAAYGLKLAIEHGYLGPVARVLIGLAAGVAVVLLSERLRRKGMAAYSYSLKAVGSALLYLTLWAGFQIYHLPQLPAGVALGMMVLVTAWNAYMAWSQDSELLAAYALAGGFLTPLLLSTGGNHEGFLLTYMAALDLAVVTLMRTKPWWRLLIPTFILSAIYYFGWFSSNYSYVDHVGPLAETIAFVMIFFAIFAVLSMRGWMRADAVAAEVPAGPAGSVAPAVAAMTSAKDSIVVPVLMPLLNAAFTGAALFAIFEQSGLHSARPWLMVALAALYLGLMRVQRSAVASAMHLAVGVVFLTVAIPLKASGHSLTTAWLVEGLVLLWASTRFEKEERQASRVLWVLSAGGYALGLGSLVLHWFVGSAFGMDGFFNRDLGAAAVAVVTLGGAVWLGLKEREKGRELEGISAAGLVAMYAVGGLLCLRQLSLTWGDGGFATGFVNASFATALVGLALLVGVAFASLRLKKTGVAAMEGLALTGLVGIDGVGLLFCLRELFAVFAHDNDYVFFDPSFATALVGLAVLAGVVYVSLRLKKEGIAAMGGLAVGSLLAIAGVGVLFCLRELASTWNDEGHQAFANASFATALVGLAVLAGLAYVAWRLTKAGVLAAERLAGATVIGFNLLTILTVEREIGALWHRGDANLQRSLAISGFLMAYGAGLLAIGFVKRTAFIRWQALVLLLFTISKVFLYDISGLSAGYRVASFMGLGAVLMGISYAYQKDWLGLKEPGLGSGPGTGLGFGPGPGTAGPGPMPGAPLEPEAMAMPVESISAEPVPVEPAPVDKDGVA